MVEAFEAQGFEAIHWSEVGDQIGTFCSGHERKDTLPLHDLDFPRPLELTHAEGPSVIRLCLQSALLDEAGGTLIFATFRHHGELLEQRAIVVIDANGEGTHSADQIAHLTREERTRTANKRL